MSSYVKCHVGDTGNSYVFFVVRYILFSDFENVVCGDLKCRSSRISINKRYLNFSDSEFVHQLSLNHCEYIRCGIFKRNPLSSFIFHKVSLKFFYEYFSWLCLYEILFKITYIIGVNKINKRYK